MKFYYVNNSLCEGCDDCSVACPAEAVYVRAGKRFIAHDKCTSCGGCIRTCRHNAVSIESIDGMVERMENADLYLSRIRRLEKELSHLNDRLEGATDDFEKVLEASPSAMAVCTSSGKVGACNGIFRNLFSGPESASDRASRYIVLEDIMPVGTVRMLLENNGPGVNTELNGKPFHLEAVTLSDGNFLCCFNDMSGGSVATACIAESLRRAVDRNMEMVRRIGTLLGDEASATLNDINAALRLIEHTGPDSGDGPR